MLHPVPVFLVVLLLAGGPAAARAAVPGARLREPEREWLTFKVRRWHSSGRGFFRGSRQLTPQEVTPPDADIRLGTTVEYDDFPADLLIFHLEARPHRRFSVELQYGTDDARGFKSTDRYWIHSPGGGDVRVIATGHVFKSPDHEDIQNFNSTAKGTLRYMAANLYFRPVIQRFQDFDGREYEHNADVLLGYSFYEEVTRRNDGVLTFTSPAFGAPPPNGPFSGLDSGYRARWQAVRFGLREELRVVEWGLGFEAHLVATPFAAFRGFGYDSVGVASGLREDDPNIRDTIAGSLIEYSAGLAWTPLKYLRLEAGYMRWYYQSRGRGDRRPIFADGTTGIHETENAVIDRSGLFVGASARF